jgi:periplasmic divalent cation tolerance protein
MSKVILVLSNFPAADDAGAAKRAAKALVKEGLAACVNLIPGVTSVYSWKGRLEEDSETTALIKTTFERYAELEVRLKELHPYETPEIIAIPIEAGSAEYLKWVRGSVKDEAE